ncbi:MAG: UTP--glucose-1-phosphate uridylyltransferase GalU [candidate division NC10 bacterium]|nr:UTP--glucose-1-phosphate uridylyltransferase GalU [candidate division NC10 bacterium]
MRIRKAVFPAAGLGTRFLPATKAQPKEMLPLVDKPVIQYVVEEAVAAGIQDVIIVTGRGKNAIEDHFDQAAELEAFLEAKGKTELLAELRRIPALATVCYIRQREPLGLGHAILTARSLVGEEPFAVLLGDNVVDAREPCIGQLMGVFARTGAPVVGIMEVPQEAVSSYGIVAGEPEGDRVVRLTGLVEKPTVAEAPSRLAIVGRYVLTPDIFPALEATAPDAGGEIQLTSGLRRLLRDRPLFGYRFEGRWYDAGSRLGFLQATVELALKRPDLGKPFRDYLRGLALDLEGPPEAGSAAR